MSSPSADPRRPDPTAGQGEPADGDKPDGAPVDRRADPGPAELGPDPEPDSDEVARMRSELSELRAQLEARHRRGLSLIAVRRVTAAIVVAVAALSFVAGAVGLWAANTALNTDRWVATVAPLPENPRVAAAVAEYTTNEVFQLVNLDQRLREVLPERAAFVVGPITGQVQHYVQQTVDSALRSDRFQPVWIEANRRAHRQALAILEGTSNVVSAHGNSVAIDLLPLINQVLRQLSAQLPTLFGRKITLPDLSSGAIPANLRAAVEKALGVTLPPNFAQFTVYDGGKLRAMQQALVTFKRGVALLATSTLVLLGLALSISPRRRRTVLQLGVWLVVAAIAVTATLRALRTQLLAQVPAGTYRDGVDTAVSTVVATLRDRGTQIIWLGVLLAVVAYLVGPGRVPVWLRHSLATAARGAAHAMRRGSRLFGRRGPVWIARHVDALRIGGVIVAAIAALTLSSWTALLVLTIALAAYEVIVTIVARVHTADPGAVSPAPAGAAAEGGHAGAR